MTAKERLDDVLGKKALKRSHQRVLTRKRSVEFSKQFGFFSAMLAGSALVPLVAQASSHREAPLIAGMPQVDASDLYAFRSYESGRSGYITIIANYIPLQDPGGGPNFYDFKSDATYAINIDRDGDAFQGLTFRFHFTTKTKNLTVDSDGKKIAVPLYNIGPIDAKQAALNVSQSYQIELNDSGKTELLENASSGGDTFEKPADNVGNKSIRNYGSYASQFIYDVRIPNCPTPGRVFVGQRKEGFVVNIGELFDLVNFNPVGKRDAEPNALSGKNVSSLALELPISCVTLKGQPVIGVYTTASLVQKDAAGVTETKQVSRLANPLVNELVIGLPDKDKFNASSPNNDAQFLNYVTNPSIPVLLNALYGDNAKIPGTPRNDLVAVYLTGVKGLNQQTIHTPSEEMRLNTMTPVTAPGSQNDLGVLGGDLAGYPNGRRPYDDVATITLRAAEGALCGVSGDCGSQKVDPNHAKPYTDGTRSAGPDSAHLHVTGAIKATDTYLSVFPYLNEPIPGSPNEANGVSGIKLSSD